VLPKEPVTQDNSTEDFFGSDQAEDLFEHDKAKESEELDDFDLLF